MLSSLVFVTADRLVPTFWQWLPHVSLPNALSSKIRHLNTVQVQNCQPQSSCKVREPAYVNCRLISVTYQHATALDCTSPVGNDCLHPILQPNLVCFRLVQIRSTSTVLPSRLSLLHKCCHALLLVICRKHGMKCPTLKQDPFCQSQLLRLSLIHI